jgi:hypothetical protein
VSHTTTAIPLSLLKRAQIWCSFLWVIVCEWLQGEVGIVLESLDQKTRDFLLRIALPR